MDWFKSIFSSSEFWTLIGVVVSGLIGYFSGKRKSAAEAASIEVDNEKEILSTYKAELEFFSKQLELTRKEIIDLRMEISKLMKQVCERVDCPTRLKN